MDREKTTYSAEQMGEALAHLIFLKTEYQTSIKKIRKLNKSLKKDDIFWNLMALKVFTCDLACYFEYGQSNIKNNVLDLFYDIIKETINDDMLYNDLSADVNKYREIARNTKEEQDVSFRVGKYFAESLGYENDISIVMSGSLEFSTMLQMLKDFIKDFEVKQ